MRCSHRAAAGFTLIELMLAIGLGLLVLYVAFVGVRVAASTVTKTNRIALENSLMRAGLTLALDEVDYWTLSDDPTDPRRQHLREFDSQRGGLPFTPFAEVPDAIGGSPSFLDSGSLMVEAPNMQRNGWNAHPLAWAAWDAKTWNRGNLVDESQVGSVHYFGTSTIYQNVDTTKSWHTWYGGQLRGMVDAMGFYGLYEYAPSNALISFAGMGAKAPLGATKVISVYGIPVAVIQNGVWLCPTDGGDHNMKGRTRNTNGSRYFLPGPGYANEDITATTPTPQLARTFAKIGYEGRSSGSFNPDTVKRFLADSCVSEPAMSYRPEHWPQVTFEVRRFIERGHQVTSCQITCMDPITGARMVIPFTCQGTTLRGARQQRGPLPTSGWATFDGPTLDYAVPPHRLGM